MSPLLGGHSGHSTGAAGTATLPGCPEAPSTPRDGDTAWSLSLGCSHPESQSLALPELEPAQPELAQSLYHTSVAKPCPLLAKLCPSLAKPCPLLLSHAQHMIHTCPVAVNTISVLVAVLRSSLFPITGIRFFQIKVD